MPPVAPMLAKPVGEIPDGDYIYEPKWDGFRSIVFRDGDEVEIGSRNERPMTSYFPELVSAIIERAAAALRDRRGNRDAGWTTGGSTSRRCSCACTRPASRVKLLTEQTPAHFVAFDLLALDDTSYLE